MQQFTTSHSQPIHLSASTEAKTYLLLALAMAFTVVGVVFGASATSLLSSPVLLICVIAELAIVFTSRWWIESRPLNYVLFALFPLLSGFTFTPYILYVLASYANGASILFNALLSTILMTLSAAVFARTTAWNLSGMAKFLFFALFGLIGFAILQIFFPALRAPQSEMIFSGLGILIFAGFTAFDLQRIQRMGKVGANPFMLALSVYLDIFNLFVYILRFMLAISGNRR